MHGEDVFPGAFEGAHHVVHVMRFGRTGRIDAE
jgi:hypothetical protein